MDVALLCKLHFSVYLAGFTVHSLLPLYAYGQKLLWNSFDSKVEKNPGKGWNTSFFVFHVFLFPILTKYNEIHGSQRTNVHDKFCSSSTGFLWKICPNSLLLFEFHYQKKERKKKANLNLFFQFQMLEKFSLGKHNTNNKACGCVGNLLGF